MATNGRVTNDNLYRLVNDTRLELKSDINRLENKFDLLEAGRLTRAESDINKLKVNNATVVTKLAAIMFIVSIVVASVIGGFVGRLFK